MVIVVRNKHKEQSSKLERVDMHFTKGKHTWEMHFTSKKEKFLIWFREVSWSHFSRTDIFFFLISEKTDWGFEVTGLDKVIFDGFYRKNICPWKKRNRP